MIKRRLERVAVTLLSVAMLLSSTGIASSLAVNEGSVSGTSTTVSAATEKGSTTVSQEGGAISTTTVATEGGTLTTEEKGSGTVADPYRISDANDLLKMQDKINLTTSANKYFVLTNDIDLSDIDADKFTSNSVYAGSLISVSKTLSASSKNVFFVLDGNGHKLRGLNVAFGKGENFALFGYINSRSTIKNLTVENSVMSVNTDAGNCAILAAENDGTISDCSIVKSALTMKNVANAGLAVAVNRGTVSKVKIVGTQTNAGGASAASHTISGNGIIGAVAGSNSGKITGASAINVGEFINSSLSGKTVYGGIVGSSSGTVSNSFASGNVTGGKSVDTVGGIAGTAAKSAKFVNNYVLVALNCSASGNGIVGAGATKDMLVDCYWSSAVSARSNSVTDYGADINDIDSLRFKTVKVGETATIYASELSASWGKASFAVNSGFSKSGDGLVLSSESNSATIKGVTADTVGRLNYTAEISLPSSVGTGNLKVTQNFNMPVLVVSAKTNGNGTSSAPLTITNSSEFSMLRYAHGIYAELDKDISVNVSAFAFNGTFNGNGHTINVAAPVFTELCGTLKNVNFVAKTDISSALLGKAVGAEISNVGVSVTSGAKFSASGANSGVMFSTVAGESKLNDCRVKADVVIAADTTNFGALAGSIIGSGTVITNSGACANIGSSKKAANAAGFIGSIKAENVSISDCYVSGKNDAGKYSFIADITAKKANITDIYMSKGTQTAVDFAKYSFIDKAQFSEWSFNDGEVAFFTGNGGKFAADLPSVKAMINSVSSDYYVSCDSSLLSASVAVENGSVVLKVSRAAGVVTVKGCAVTVTNKKTGLYTTVKVSNGLEKDSAGNYIVANAYDLAYISENISELNKASFVVESDIDMSVIPSFAPIGGTLIPFSGKFNGNGYTISNLKINGTSKVGLFASLNNAEIKNVVISSADVSAKGIYTAVLAGQIIGSTKLENITVTNSKVSADGIYSGLIAGSVDSGSLIASGISITSSSVDSKANYVGAFAGYAACGGNVADINIEKVNLSGAEYVAGVIGLIDGKLAVKSAAVSDSEIKGVSEVSGVAAGKGESSLSEIKVIGTEISTVSDSAAFVAGGIASGFGSQIDGAEVRNVTVKAGIASAVVGRTFTDTGLTIKNVNVCGAKVVSEKVNTVSAGVLAVHNSGSAVIIENCTVDAETTVSSTSVAAGVVGDITGEESSLIANNIKSFAKVGEISSADAAAFAGLVGKLSASALNNVQFKNVKILGSVSANASVGGLIGVVKGIGNYNGLNAVIADCVCAAQIITDSKNGNAGVVIGSVENDKAVNSDNIDSVVKGTVISTYFGGVGAFGISAGITAKSINDMDKPNGTSIVPSVGTLSTFGETEVTLSNLPNVKGYTFDSETGWTSEAEERITIVSSTADKLILKANHMADISIVAYYVLDSDSDVRIPVHFAMKSDVRTPLKGEGTSKSPYLISNAYDLESVAYYDSMGKYFALAQDISFKKSDFEFGGGFYNVGNGVVTIGSAESGFKGTFTGLYNGKIHLINGLALSGNTFGGLFGATDGAVISDLVINNAVVEGLNYAGVIVGSAKNTVIRNITVNGSSAVSSEFGSVSGIIAGRAENVTAEKITINNSSASTTLFATSATVETAGGFAGAFSGRISDIKLNGASVKSGTVAGGLVGSGSAVNIQKAEINASVNGKISGGVIGSLETPTGTSVSNCFVSGSVNGENLAAGVIAEVGSDSGYLAKVSTPLISDTVVTAKADAEISAAVIAKADKETFSDNDKNKTDIFSNVYYSSYTNESVFGTQELNSYQNTSFAATDLSAVKCVIGGTEKSFITLDGERTVLGDSDIVLAAGTGTYKSFELCGHSFGLESVESDPNGVVVYNAEDSSLGADGAIDGAKIVFKYNDGLEIAIPVAYSSLLAGSGTKADPYTVGTADEFAIMMQNGENSGVYYKLTADIDLSGVKSAESFGGILDGTNHVIYDFSGSSLFDEISGTVKNLGVVGFDIDSDSSLTLGALAGTLNGAFIENCAVVADVNASGRVQDAGIIAGRAVNGTKIENCITSGRVLGSKVIAAGGLVGEAYNVQVNNCVSTAFVNVGGYAGGLVGDAEYSTVSNSVFGNMVTSSEKKAGNIAGRFADTSKAENVLFDGRTSRNQVTAADGSESGMKSSSTKDLSAAALSGFVTTDGYAIPASLKSSESSAKFATAVEFAAMTIKYVSGMNIGTALNYTDVKIAAQVNSNAVSVDRTNGLVITLMKNKDFGDTDNKIARYANPASEGSATVSYSIVDSTKALDGKLVGVMLKSKLEDSANSFGFFTKIGSEIRTINGVSVTDGGIYVDLSLPIGYGYKVKATDADGNVLEVKNADSEGRFIKTDKSESVDITFEIVRSEPDWGVRSVWSVIGK